MDMSGISKGRIQARIDALKEDMIRQQTLVAQYAAAIAELDMLLRPEEGPQPQPQPTEYIEAIEAIDDTAA